MKQARTFCPSCREDRDVEILLKHEQIVEAYTISEGRSDVLATNLIVQCNGCHGLMIFDNATPESIASQTALWPQYPDWQKALPWSQEFNKMDREARLASNPSEKVRALARIFEIIFADHDCKRKDFVSSFEALVEQKQLDPCFLRASKILILLEKTLGENPPKANHNDMLDIQNFYLAVRSQLYETPSLIRVFDEQWSGFSEQFFAGDSS